MGGDQEMPKEVELRGKPAPHAALVIHTRRFSLLFFVGFACCLLVLRASLLEYGILLFPLSAFGWATLLCADLQT